MRTKNKVDPLFYQRTTMLLGEPAMAKIKQATVAVCGIGGVGAGAAESLARAGIGKLCLIDCDYISPSNLNRQLHTTTQNLDQPKAQAMADRIKWINPACITQALKEKITPENCAGLLGQVDYILDAVDDVGAKVAIITYAKANQIPIISCMGTGNKLHPELLELADISQTQVCPLARKLRRELKNVGILKGVAVVYSQEQPRKPYPSEAEAGKMPPASISFVPPVAGMIMCGRVIRSLCGLEE